MSRIHDLGGLRGLGSIPRDADDAPVFDHLWEARVFALMKCCMDVELFSLDEIRFAIEKLPPATYLTVPYYEKWFLGLRRVLIDHGIIRDDDLPLQS